MTAIDRARTALVLLDLQNDVVDPEGAIGSQGGAAYAESRGTLGRAAQLLGAGRSAGLQVIHVGVAFRPGHPEADVRLPLGKQVKSYDIFVEGTWGTEFHDSVAPTDDEPQVFKTGMSAFAGTDLDLLLKVGGIDALLLAGIATNLAVEGTARDAADRGYAPTVIEDCCAGFSDELHAFSCEVIARFAAVARLEDVMTALEQD